MTILGGSKQRYGQGLIVQRNPNNPNSLTVILNVGTRSGKRQRLWRTFRRQTGETDRQFRKRVELERDKLLLDRRRGADIAPGRMTVSEYLDYWQENHVSGLGARTQRSYKSILDTHVIPTIGDKRLADLRPVDIQAIYSAMRKKGRSGTTQLHVHRTLKKALSDAVRWALTDSNVADRVTPPRSTTGEAKAATVGELARILVAADKSPIMGVMVRLTVWTGLRLGEVLGLRWQDIDFDARRLQVRQTLGNDHVFRPPKTKGSRRSVSLSPEIVALLSAYKEAQSNHRESIGEAYADSDLVFADPLGKPIGQFKVNYYWRQIRDAAAVSGLRFHDLRHSHASQLFAAGVPLHEIQARLGHSLASTTLNIYGHYLVSPEDTSASVMDKILSGR